MNPYMKGVLRAVRAAGVEGIRTEALARRMHCGVRRTKIALEAHAAAGAIICVGDQWVVAPVNVSEKVRNA